MAQLTKFFSSSNKPTVQKKHAAELFWRTGDSLNIQEILLHFRNSVSLSQLKTSEFTSQFYDLL